MREGIYYIDDYASVTNERVVLGNWIYPLGDIKWIGLQTAVKPYKTSRRYALYLGLPLMLAVLGCSVFFFLDLFYFHNLTDTQRIILLILCTAGSMLINTIVLVTGHRTYTLALSGTFGYEVVRTSDEPGQMPMIVQAVNRALIDRYAKLRSSTSKAHA
jgi:hypothetical protein